MSTLHSRITGSGPRAVVLLGALGSSADMWVPVQDAVNGSPDDGTFRLIALEHRGHGASPTPTHLETGNEGSTEISDLADDVLDTLDALDCTGPVDLVGLSIGGAVCQYLAAHAPDRVRTLTLMCTATVFGDAEDWTIRASSVRARGIDTLRELAESTVDRWLTAPFRDAHPATTLAVSEMITRTTPAGYAACCDALSTFDGHGMLSQISAPTFTVAGVQDPTCPPVTLEAMNATLRTAGTPTRHLELPGAHLLPVEYPVQVATALTEFWGQY